MKSAPFCILALLAVQASASTLSPITRVVELLNGLAAKVEVELKNEESLYEKYVCWATTVINFKTQANKDAESRISELKAYIEDLDAGRVELTSERQDLNAEMKGLNSDMETAKAMREEEHEDFLMAKDEMEKAIAALAKSIDVLTEATKDHQDGVFMAIKSDASASSFNADALSTVFALARKELSSSDAEFLQRLLSADVPTWDWNKLNRDANFKKSYKARSGRILEVLTELKATFDTNLAEAEAAEAKAAKDYDTLSAAKGAQKSSTSDSLNKMEVEGAARGESRMSSSEELASLEEQVKADTKFISETQDSLAKKKEEWKIRKDLRRAEIEAMNKAVAILHSDDARDLFKRSFKSQGFSFLSLRQSSAWSLSAVKVRELDAAKSLRAAAAKSGDARLKELAELVSDKAAGHFDAVIEAIDKMIVLLKKEEAKDLANKEKCEKERAENTRTAVVASRVIDEHTDAIARLKSEIAQLEKDIAQAEEEIATIKEQMTEAARIRADENAEWKKSDADDKDAAEVVQQAIDVLTSFYQENGLALLHLKSAQIPEVKAGEAPPPPPPTWEAPYGGAMGEQDGVVSILEMIHEDILKDQTKAKNEEDAAEASYQAFVQDSTFAIQTLEASISTMEGQKSNKEKRISDRLGMRLTKKGELDGVLATMSELKPGCDFVTINYPVRLENRQIELDGLFKAKTILLGAVSAPAPAS
mmetsp:Transcript_41871/g.98130  ORF Transcript_41871/g.98130 Transcript_41871/m.98130 type:complete len:708 (-) Transcript_41871:64-2187(-)